MAHKEQFDYVNTVKLKYPDNFKDSKVLEIGSLNLNGSVRIFFTDCIYLGLDVDKGRDVDLVCEGQDYTGDDKSFDTVISCECFEHNPYWIDTFINMHRVCKVNGLVIISCATEGRAEHGTVRSEPSSSPLTVGKGWTYYKNLIESDFRDNFILGDMFKEFFFEVNPNSHDLYFYGVKK